MTNLTRTCDTVGLIAVLGLCLAVSGIGGVATATSVDSWYQMRVTALW